jgi:acetyl/propionyl-CoA carboxylase alpha subunit
MPAFYDSLLAKVVTWGRWRDEAIARMDRALTEYVIEGLKTTLPFHRTVMADPVYRAGKVHLGYVDRMIEVRA